MKEGRLLEFSIQCDPASMIGYVQFAIVINVEKAHYRNVRELIHREFQESILYHPSIIDPNDSLTFVLYGENVFKVDSVLATVDSIEWVRSADIYILTKLQYYDDWIIREIDERLGPQQLQKAIHTALIQGLRSIRSLPLYSFGIQAGNSCEVLR